MKLEERIERILCTPELELDGNAYAGKYELNNFGSIKEFISKVLRLDEKGKNIPYTNQSTGDEFTISGNSAGKLAMHWRDGETYQKTIAHIPEIIEKMQYLDKMKEDKEGVGSTDYSYYVMPVKLGVEIYTIFSTVRHEGREVYYDQNVFKGTPENVFEEAKTSPEKKYERLNKILNRIKKDSQSQIPVITGETSATSTSKYNK